jgi:hypothetical protein
MDRRIADYISANRHRYTREAIRQQLIAAGFEPAEIDATWAALETPDADDVVGEKFWSQFLLIVVGINVVIFLGVALLTGLLPAIGGGGFVIAVIFAILLIIGALVAWAAVAATRPAQLSRGMAMTVGIAIPLVFALLVGGACYALLGTFGVPPPPAVSGTLELVIESPEFRGQGEAMCQPTQADGRGFDVYAMDLGRLDGRMVSVSVYSSPSVPNGPAEQIVSISAVSETSPAIIWDSGMGPSRVDMNAAPDGLSGTVAFESLQAMQEDPSAHEVQPISGTMTWECK